MITRPHPSSLLLLLLAFTLTGCSSFNSKWSSFKPQPLPPSGIGGRWEGKWISEVSGHEGRLRCIVEKSENAKATEAIAIDYRFSFSATWGPGIVSDYDIEMKVQPAAEGGMAFEGDMDLGVFMGVYRCKGRIVGDQFTATYTSDQDHGTFEMSRPVK